MVSAECSILAVKHNTNSFLFAVCPTIELSAWAPFVSSAVKGKNGWSHVSLKNH